MLTAIWFWAMHKNDSTSQLGHVIPMGCDVAIFYFIACAVQGWPK